MKIITIYNKKGGTGCTKLTYDLASWIFNAHNAKVAVAYFAAVDRPLIEPTDIPYYFVPRDRRNSNHETYLAFVHSLLPKIINTDYLFVDIPKSSHVGLFETFIEGSIPIFTIVPADNDHMTISCTEEVVNYLKKKEKKYCVLLNNVYPDGEISAREELRTRRIIAFNSGMLREDTDMSQYPFHLSKETVWELLYMKINATRIKAGKIFY